MKKRKSALSETLKQEFKKDLELFENFLVMLNNSSPIRNVELMWADDLDLLNGLFDPAQRPRINTGNALVQIMPAKPAGAETQGRTSPRTGPSPSTHFCDLVHGFGSHEEETCARSDKPARERCRATGHSQVYPCHVGLTDIAVPVISEGRYLGTLFSGQVLTTAPTPEGFAYVKASLDGQPHIDMASLEEAYYRVPVVTTAQLAEMLRILEVFARYLANAWRRLEIIGEFQRVRVRELALDRRQLAEMLLSGPRANAPDQMLDNSLDNMRLLASNIGLERLPDRILVVRMETAAPPASRPDESRREVEVAAAIGSHLTFAKVLHVIEDRCQSWPNTLATVVTPGEICVFTAHKARTPAHERMVLDEMAQTLLRIVRAQGGAPARVGICGLHHESPELLRAYHEASAALDSGHAPVNWFDALPERQQQPAQALARVLQALQASDPSAVTGAVRDFLAAAAPAVPGASQLQQVRGLLTWACEHLAREIVSLGISAASVNAAKEGALQIIMGSPSSFPMAEAFRGFVERVRQDMAQIFSQREEKIVLETHRLVRELGPEKVTIQEIARNLQLSAGHLGRVYSRTTGHTLEEYLIRQRLEMARRLLLDPRLHVAEVADRCGFCNPAYFASVFKKYMRCTPRAFARQPQRWTALQPIMHMADRLHHGDLRNGTYGASVGL
jgi:AraC-like DNA-binding protein/ligand-binding sensor protein